MRYPDIAILGGRLAGSIAAAHARTCRNSDDLIDPHEIHPFDFCVEKINCDKQLDRFCQTESPIRWCAGSPTKRPVGPVFPVMDCPSPRDGGTFYNP
jgi:hypothetical protein